MSVKAIGTQQLAFQGPTWASSFTGRSLQQGPSPKSCAHPLEVMEETRGAFNRESSWSAQIGRDQMETLVPRLVQRGGMCHLSKTVQEGLFFLGRRQESCSQLSCVCAV